MKRRRIGIAIGIGALVAALALWLWQRGGEGGGGRGGAAKSTEAGGAAGPGARASKRIDVATVARGSIEGTVRDPGGAAVAGARVCGYAFSDELPDDETRDPLCTASGADGRYRLDELLPARYEVHAHAARFAPGSYRAKDAGGRDRDGVKLAAGEALRDIDIELGAGGVEVAGIVKDIGGGPVGGAWVYLRGGGDWRPWRRGGGVATVQSEVDGTFRAWVARGTVHASAEADGYAEGETEAIAPGQTIEILLTPESVLAGRVIEKASGAPVPGARVSAGGDWYGGDGTSWASTMTDEDGRFRITRLAPGRYKPGATAPGRHGQAAESVLLGLGQTVEDVLIEVHPASVVTGRVVLDDEATPCPRGWVQLEDAKAGSRESGGIEDDGRVELEAVLPGTYEVKVSCPGYLADEEYPEVVVAAGADPEEQVWKVGAGGRVRGVVLAHDGRPVDGASVNAQPVVATDLWSAWQRETTEADGTFVIEGMAAGRYKVTATPRDAPGNEEPVEVDVPAGGEATVEIRVPQGGAIAGAVRDEDGAPVARVHVRVRVRGRRWSWDANDSTQTLDDGSFRIEGLPVGTHRVTAMRDRWGSALRAPGKSDDDRSGETVEVRAGKTARVELVVERQSGVIRGRVVDASGVAITDAFVDAQRESEAASAAAGSARREMRWGWSRRPVLTDTGGGFVIDNLSKGTYTVRAYRRGGGEALVEGVAVGADVTVTIREPGSIGGTVTVEGGGAPDRMTVSVRDGKTGFRRREEFFRTGGAFVLRDLPGGTYEVSVTAAAGTGKAEAVLAEGQALRGIAITLASRARVTGRLIAGDDGKPLAGYMIQVSPVGAGDFEYDFGASPPVSEADGRFEVESAPAGRVQVMAFSFGQDTDYAFVRKLVTLEGGTTTDLGDLKVPRMRAKMGDDPGDLGFDLKQSEPGTTPEDEKLVVALVRPDGPAASSGLQVGDEIVSVDGQDVRGDVFTYWTLAFVPPGTTLTFGLARGATVTITAGPPR